MMRMLKIYKLPTTVALLILGFGLAVGIFLVQNKALFFIDAKPTREYQDIKIPRYQDIPSSTIKLPQLVGSGVSRFNLEPIK